MNNIKSGRNAYIKLLESFNRFFLHQSKILLKEIKTIKYATNYYREYENDYKNNNLLSSELAELEIIYDGIKYIEIKVGTLLKQFNEDKIEDEIGDFYSIIKNIRFSCDNSHIGILPIIDIKIEQFQELFDELNFYKQSYFNLIDSKEFPYIPTPKFNKRFRNANLGLFLNKQLNDTDKNSYRSLISEFYKKTGLAKENDINNFNGIKFFSKWSYSTDHYIKKFNSLNEINSSQKNIYISMSYAYLDKTIFHPIAFHEISHAMKHQELKDEDNEFLEESILTFRKKNIFKKNKPLDGLYKEILCDLSAVYSTGYSYIMSLIHIGFFQLKDLFLEYQEFDPSENIEKAKEEANKLFKIESLENIVPKIFDFNINNIDLAVRFLVLLKLCEKLEINNTYINGIRYILEIIFPPIYEDGLTNEKVVTFQKIYEFISKDASDYNQSRYLVHSLYEKFQSIILTDELIEVFKERNENLIFKSFKDKIIENTTNQNILSMLSDESPNKNLNNCKTIYDLLWLCREQPIECDERLIIYEKEINRLFNIYSVFYEYINENKNNEQDNIINTFNKIFSKFFTREAEETLFYNFEFIKYKSTKKFHPFIEYMKDSGYKDGNNDIKEMSYILASYDIALLKKVNNKTTLSEQFQDYPLKRNESEKNKYFIDRHSLFLLNDIVGNKEENKGIFATIIQIKLANTFSKDDSKILALLLEYFENYKEYFSLCRIFKSMGVEDYLIYVKGLKLCDTKKFGKNFISEFDINMEIEDLILLEDNQNIEQELSDSIDFEIISFAKINTKNKEAKKYFSTQLVDFLPNDDKVNLIKTPTNRFDSIISWKVNNNTLNNIKEHLEYIYYQDDNIYSDFNIEIIHKK